MSEMNKYEDKCLKEEQALFYSILYHDARDGQMIRVRLKDGEVLEQKSTCEVQELAYTGTDSNVYTSVNLFKGCKRTADQLFNKTAIYIDIDCHSCIKEEREKEKEKAIELLRKAIDNGELAAPTMITDSGRGFGLFFVMKKSIANVKSAERSLAFFDDVYVLLLNKIKKILKGEEKIDVDMQVRDASRICRVPGTRNLKAGKYCRLITINYDSNGEPLYYDLGEIVTLSKLKKKKEHAKSAKIIPFNRYKYSFLEGRIERLKKLQEMRGYQCVDRCREMMCFIMYSALTQINPHEEAVKQLYTFNQAFTDPLPGKELDHIINETDEHVVPDGKYKGQKGFYPYSDLSMIQSLDITEEEIKEIGFGRNYKREKAKKENQRKRQERNAAIVSMIKEHPEMTYAEIAEFFNISTRTVERIAKSNQVQRYCHAKKEANESEKKEEEQKVVEIQSITMKETVSAENTKTDIFCTESIKWCAFYVQRVLFPEFFDYCVISDALMLSDSAYRIFDDLCFFDDLVLYQDVSRCFDFYHADLRDSVGSYQFVVVAWRLISKLAQILNSYRVSHSYLNVI